MWNLRENPRQSISKQKGDLIMDELLNEESQNDTQQTEIPQSEPVQAAKPPVRRRKKAARRLRFSIPIPEFLTHIGEDVRWYYDVRLWSPLILLLLILAILPGKQKEVPVETTPETIPIVIQDPVETVPEPEPIDPEAEALARLADSVGSGRSDNAKIIIMWVAINRSEDRSNGYGMSLAEEIARPNQWQGYDENFPYSEATYKMAKDVLSVQRNDGLRPLEPDMLWLVLNDNGSVTVRNQFTASKNQKWIEKTVK